MHHEPESPRDSDDPDDVIAQRDEIRDQGEPAIAEGVGAADTDQTVVDDAGPEPDA